MRVSESSDTPIAPQRKCGPNGPCVSRGQFESEALPILCIVHCRISVGSASNGVVVMSLRTELDVLEYEIRQEQAATIGRLARELRDALDALDTFKASSGKMATDSRDPQRARLVDAAAYALWNFVVQRECSGFRGTEQVFEDYAVPVEVRAKMGATRPRE